MKISFNFPIFFSFMLFESLFRPWKIHFLSNYVVGHRDFKDGWEPLAWLHRQLSVIESPNDTGKNSEYYYRLIHPATCNKTYGWNEQWKEQSIQIYRSVDKK